jgi:hypothetical protein
MVEESEYKASLAKADGMDNDPTFDSSLDRKDY